MQLFVVLFRLCQHDSKLATARSKLVATRLSNVKRLLLSQTKKALHCMGDNLCKTGVAPAVHWQPMKVTVLKLSVIF